MMIAERVIPEAINETRCERKWTDEIFAIKEALQELMNMGAFEPNGIKPDARSSSSGQAVPWINGTWEISILNAQNTENYGIFSCQKSPAAKAASITTSSLHQAYAIGANSEHKDVAWSLLKFMFSQERQEAVVRSNVLPPPWK